MKKCSLIIILLALSVGFISVDAKATFTVATFADPSGNSGNSLFTVDFSGGTLNGGWADTETGSGLTLEMGTPYGSHTFTNAWFEMDEVAMTSYTVPYVYGLTGVGAINFYAHGTTTNPLLTISFENGFVSQDYLSGSDETPEGIFEATNVTITGSEITGGALSEELFTFSFANLAKLPGQTSLNSGFTATAAFTSSAVPEPATMVLLGLGSLALLRKRKA